MLNEDLKYFLERLPHKRTGIANFQLWFQLVIDTWRNSGTLVWDYLLRGDEYFKSLPDDVRRKEEKESLYTFSRSIAQSVSDDTDEDDYEYDSRNFVGLRRDDWLELNPKFSNHSVQQRITVWEHVIKLYQERKMEEAADIVILERLLLLEVYFIQRILLLPYMFNYRKIGRFLDFWCKVHNTIKENWKYPEYIDETITFRYTTTETERVPYLYRGQVKGCRSALTEKKALNRYLDDLGIPSHDTFWAATPFLNMDQANGPLKRTKKRQGRPCGNNKRLKK